MNKKLLKTLIGLLGLSVLTGGLVAIFAAEPITPTAMKISIYFDPN